MEEKDSKNNFDKLRQQAKEQLADDDAPSPELDDDLHTIIHELKMHQLELQLQNEELNEAQAKLSQSQAELKDLFDFAPISYLVLDKAGKISRANFLIAELLQISRDQLIGTNFIQYVHPSDQDNCYLTFQQVIHSGERASIDIRLASNPIKQPMVVHMQAIPTNHGSLNIRVSLTDITARKYAEQQLAQLHQLDRAIWGLKSIDEIAQTTLLNISKIGQFKHLILVVCDPEVCDMYFLQGDSPTDSVNVTQMPRSHFEHLLHEIMQQKPFTASLPIVAQFHISPDDFQIIPIYHQEALGFLAFHCLDKAMLDEYIHISSEFAVHLGIAIRQVNMLERINQYTSNLEMLVDKRTQALRDSELQYRLLAENMSDIVVMHNLQGQCEYISPNIKEKLGYDAKKIQHHGITQLMHPDDTIPLNDSAIKVWFTGRHITRLRHIEGHYLWFESEGKTTDGQEVDTPKIITTLRDVTDRVRAQRAERKQREFTEGLLKVTKTLNRTLDLDVVIKRMFEAMEEIIPYTIGFLVIKEDVDWQISHTHNFADKDFEIEIKNTYDITAIPICDEVFETLEARFTSDLNANGLSEFLDKESVNSALCVPIVIDDQLVAVLNLMHHDIDFYDAVLSKNANAFAEQAGTAIRNAQLHKKGQDLAALEERQYLARELHDAVSQTLFSAGAIAETLPKILDKGDINKVRGLLDTLAKLTDGARAEMRNLLLELRPNAFETAEMRTLIEQLINAFKARKETPIVADIDDELLPLSGEQKMHIFRIIQGALNNIVQHADAKSVYISVHNQDNQLHIIIRDDGKGFDISNVTPDRHGLKIMKERAAKMNAMCEITSTKGKGTEIKLSVPITSHSHDTHNEQ